MRSIRSYSIYTKNCPSFHHFLQNYTRPGVRATTRQKKKTLGPNVYLTRAENKDVSRATSHVTRGQIRKEVDTSELRRCKRNGFHERNSRKRPRCPRHGAAVGDPQLTQRHRHFSRGTRPSLAKSGQNLRMLREDITAVHVYQALNLPDVDVPSRSALSCSLFNLIASIRLAWLSADAFATWYSGASRGRWLGNVRDSCGVE